MYVSPFVNPIIKKVSPSKIYDTITLFIRGSNQVKITSNDNGALPFTHDIMELINKVYFTIVIRGTINHNQFPTETSKLISIIKLTEKSKTSSKVAANLSLLHPTRMPPAVPLAGR
jgi:hypothetical protein